MKILRETKEYKLDSIILNNLIKDLEKEFISNINIIQKANIIDAEFSKKAIEIEEIKNILKTYLNWNLDNKDISKKLVVYSGNPYLTINILMQAIITKTQILLFTEEFMVGVNNIIFTIFKEVLKKYKINNLFETKVNYSVKQIKSLSNEYEEIIVIGNTTTMQLIENLDNVKFYPYNNIIVHSDNDEFEKLKQVIYKYANENGYELEILYEETTENAIDVINADRFVDIVVLLSKNEETKELFSNIKNKKVFINKNPFISKVGNIYNYFNE